MATLKDIRLAKGLKQIDIGEKLFSPIGVSRAYAQKLISLWETGRALPDEAQKDALCEVLEVQREELSFESEIPTFLSVAAKKSFLLEIGVREENVFLILKNPIVHKSIANAMNCACDSLRKTFEEGS